MPTSYDALIIGGSYAGLSAALALGRSLRRVLVIDAGQPCNRFAKHSQNFLTQDGRPPGRIAADARAQIERYPTVRFVEELATDLRGEDGDFRVTTASGMTYRGKKLLFATGLADELPELPGMMACWGKTVIHCPYCHGYELKQRPTAVLINNDHAPFMARLVRNWTDELTLLTNGPAAFDVAEVTRIGVPVDERPLRELIHTNGVLQRVTFETGEALPVGAMYLHPRVSQHCPLPERHGVALAEHGLLRIDEAQSTSVAGIYAAGDCTTAFRSVANAVAQGNRAAAMLNHALVAEAYA